MSKERRETGLIECMEDPVTNGFAKARKVVQERLRLGAELVLVGLSEVSPVEGRQVGVRMKCRENQRAVRMKYTVPFPQRG